MYFVGKAKRISLQTGYRLWQERDRQACFQSLCSKQQKDGIAINTDEKGYGYSRCRQWGMEDPELSLKYYKFNMSFRLWNGNVEKADGHMRLSLR